MSILEGWDNFYVILGSAAAGLLGLTFVVIALISDTRRANLAGTSGYITPTIIHFGTVLGLSCFLSVPRQNVTSISIGSGAAAIGLLIYTGVITSNMRRFASNYVPVLEDWIWHVMLPAIAYAALLAMSFLLWHLPRQSMYGIASSLMLLLFVGVHNSWDVAISVTIQKKKEEEKKQE
jgi:hypothetical protein